MKLIRLIAKNFKKLSDFSAEFSDGLNVIVGENAQGKSTLLQAIEAALFGVTVVPGKKENIPTWGQTSFSLELWLEVGGSVYVLTRTKSTAKLLKRTDGMDELVANGNTPVTAYIEQLLGLTAKDFNLFVQSKQGETSGVLTFGAAALSRKVEEFAGVDLIDQVSRRAAELASEQRAVAAANDVGAEALAEAVAAVELTQAAVARWEAELFQAEQAWEALPAFSDTPPSPSSQALTDQRRKADKHLKQLAEAESSLTMASALLQEAEKAAALAGPEVDVTALEVRLQAETAEVRRLRSRVSEVRERIADAKAARAAWESAVSAARAAREKFSQSSLDQASADLEAAQARYREAGEMLAVTQARLSDLVSLQDGATCPTCGTTLSEHDPEVLAAEIGAVRGAVSDLLAARGVADLDVNEARKALAAWTKDRDALERAEAALAKLSQPAEVDHGAELADLEALLEAAGAAAAQTTSELKAASATNAAVATTATRLAKARNSRELAAAEVERLGSVVVQRPSDEEIDAAFAAESKYQEAGYQHTKTVAAAKEALITAKAELRSARASAEASAAGLAALEARAAARQQARTLQDKADRLARFLRARRQSYLEDVWTAVMAAATKHVKTASRGLISSVANEDGEFFYEEDGVLAPVASASGAQKAFIGTAVRIGLARALYGSDSLLIFDEPTEAMREHNAAGLVASLAGCARQTLLITHREQDQTLASTIIEVGSTG